MKTKCLVVVFATLAVQMMNVALLCADDADKSIVTVRAGAVMWRTSSSAGDDVETKVIAGNQQKITGYVVKGIDGSVVITDAASGNTTRIAYNDVLKIKNFSDVEETAETFDQLQLLINPGDRISVTDTRGRVSKGKIEAISPSAIRLRVNGASRNFL